MPTNILIVSRAPSLQLLRYILYSREKESNQVPRALRPNPSNHSATRATPLVNQPTDVYRMERHVREWRESICCSCTSSSMCLAMVNTVRDLESGSSIRASHAICTSPCRLIPGIEDEWNGEEWNGMEWRGMEWV